MSISINMAKTLSLSQAEKYIGVSRATLWRIIRQYQIETQPDVLDRRIKRVRRADLDKVIEEANRVREGEAA
jgi:predicted DNA-binding transcriptional regulator AlpA